MEQLFLTLSWQVPDNVKLQKDTVLSLVKGATVFINYLGALSTLSPSHFFFLIQYSQLLRTSYNITETHP